jgi:hypothetical protein
MEPGEDKNRIFGFLDSWFPYFIILGWPPVFFTGDIKVLSGIQASKNPGQKAKKAR